MKLSDARKAVKWFLRQFGMESWNVTLFFDDPPEGLVGDLAPVEQGKYYGLAGPDTNNRQAHIWLNREPHADGTDMLATLFHELMHVYLAHMATEWGIYEEWHVIQWSGILAARYREILRA